MIVDSLLAGFADLLLKTFSVVLEMLLLYVEKSWKGSMIKIPRHSRLHDSYKTIGKPPFIIRGVPYNSYQILKNCCSEAYLRPFGYKSF